jgi:UDP-N-acetylglucosamine--N-acetylmuramyl-(pentapeptide) pyrophosphoryl-undecaprenol N-acetylglucosamine transferase
MLAYAALVSMLREVDLVVCHAGVGSVVTALAAGHVPVVAPRRKVHNEHVDDHQTQFAEMLRERGLAIVRDADEITAADFDLALRMTARRLSLDAV